MGVALTYAEPMVGRGARMVFYADEDGVLTRLGDLECAERSFRRIERDGAWWVLAGRDRQTGELVYLAEMA